MNPSDINAIESAVPPSRWCLFVAPPQRYVLAVLSIGVAVVALLLLEHFGFRPPTGMLLLTAVAINAWYGERGPALFALILAFLCMDYFFVAPRHSFYIASSDLPYYVSFLSLAALIWWFSTVRRRGEQGRNRAEGTLRESEERFRTLVQFSFDVYWETDAQHRFTRQDFSDRLSDAPAPSSETGKTRWEVPYLEPDEEAWRKHCATLDAHLPFRDFELARPTADGGKRYVSVSGMPVFDAAGRFAGYRGVGWRGRQRGSVNEGGLGTPWPSDR